MEPETKQCQNCKTDFTIEPDDFNFYEKIDVPAPSLCAACRYQRRIGGRNEWILYSRNCSLCDTKMVSIYNPDYAGSVICLDCFWGDSWDPLEFGREFDFNEPFFDQFVKLREPTPKVTVAHFRCVDSPYTNQSQDLKNCYLTFAGDQSEDCMYGNWFFNCRSSIDCSIVYGSEFIYESLHTSGSSRSTYLVNCRDCIESHFLEDCSNCTSCFGCVGLRHKSYCWFNEQLTRQEYNKKLQDFTWSVDNIDKVRKKLSILSLASPHKYYQGHTVINSTGDYIYNLKNSMYAFNAHELENVSYCQDVAYGKDGRDITEVAYTELDYEIEGVGYSSINKSTSRSWNVSNCDYCLNCFSCEYCFGCVSLNKKKYCIFNKQYTKEEYQELRAKIIAHMKKTGEWGQFFPVSTSMFAYNETVAQEYFPLTKEQVLENGWKWYERTDRKYNPTVSYKDLPNVITEADESIVGEVITCKSYEKGLHNQEYTNCTTAFRITLDELNFYKKMNLPIPHKCFMCRFQDRLRLRNPRNLWKRTTEDGVEVMTSYAPDRPEKIYSEKGYNDLVN